MKKNRYWLPTGNHQENVQLALAWLNRVLSPDGIGVVALPGKRNIEGSAFETILGRDAIKALQAGRTLRLQGGRRIVMMTPRSIPDAARSAAAGVAAFGADELVDAIEALPRLTSILAIQWAQRDLQGWRRSFSPSLLGEEASAAPEPEISPLLREALRALHDLANVSTGIAQYDDRALAIEVFQRLDREQEEIDPAEVRAWLIGKAGWKPAHAQDVADIAEGVREGRRFATRGRGWVLPDDVVERWRKKAAV